MLNTLAFYLFDPVHGNWQYLVYVMAPCMLLAMWAQLKVKSAYAHAAKIPPASGLTGAQAAARIMLQAGHDHVDIQETQGWLSDHYDPQHKVLRLSPEVYHGRSLASLGIAAHEAGHALQDAQHYAPLVWRNGMVPMAAIGSNLSYLVLFAGFMMGIPQVAWVGVGLFALTVLFQLVNLPCEFNASSRAREQLLALRMVSPSEDKEVKRVLDAAAMTYVAAVIASVLTLLYYLWRLGLLGGHHRDE